MRLPLIDNPMPPSVKKVLAVDDEQHIRRLIEVNLQRAGYEVILAASVPDAVARAKSEQPDLIVLDVLMAHQSSFDLIKTLRSDPETARIPVIMLSSRPEVAARFRGWDDKR